METTNFFAYALDIFLHLDMHLDVLLQNYGTWLYGILFLVIFCETGLVVTPFLPGDSLLFMVGALAAKSQLNVEMLILLLCIAAILGDSVNYSIGRFLGRYIERIEKIPFLNKQALRKTEDFYQKHGGKTIIIARFMPLIRTFAPFVAGLAHMHYIQFVVYNVVGGVVWVGSLVLLGYWFGNIPIIKQYLSFFVMAIIIISVLPMVIAYLKARFKNKAIE